MPASSPLSLAGKAAALALFLAAPIMVGPLDPNNYQGGRSKDQGAIEERNTSAIAMMLGEFRTGMADMMFIKTERYLHYGVAYAPHIDLDKAAQSGEIAAKEHDAAGHDHDHEHGHDHEAPPAPDPLTVKPGDDRALEFARQFEEHQAVYKSGGVEPAHEGEEGHIEAPTMIRTAADDFRGFIGNLHRQVSPWKDPREAHIHADGTELLPWYRIMTLTDPHNVRGYMIGAWWLKSLGTEENVAEARKFIAEGIKNNPRSFQLHLMSGNILRAIARMERDKRRDDDALALEREALTAYRRAGDFAAKTRPADPSVEPWWSNYMEEDARASMRFAVLMERDFGTAPEAIRLANVYLKVVPDDVVLQRAARGEGFLDPAAAASSP